MADFKTHITTSTVLGVGYGIGGFLLFDIPLTHAMVAGTLCSVAGMLPDLDSASGIPQREMLCFMSVLAPMLMMRRMRMLGVDPETMVFIAILTYIFIRFVVGRAFKRYAKHRGMWHSLPAAMIAGLTTFLVCLSPELEIRLYKAWAVVIGFISHLILDEIYSVDLSGNSIRIKKSFGTAMKWFSPSLWANISTYGKLAILIVLALGDTSLMHYLGREPINVPSRAAEWFAQPGEDDASQLR